MDLNVFDQLLANPFSQAVFYVLLIWSLIWKGIALWKSSHNEQRNWFIVLLILNTFGILEIVYIFYFQRPKNIDEIKKP